MMTTSSGIIGGGIIGGVGGDNDSICVSEVDTFAAGDVVIAIIPVVVGVGVGEVEGIQDSTVYADIIAAICTCFHDDATIDNGFPRSSCISDTHFS